MTFSTMTLITAFATLGLGLGFLFAPAAMLKPWGLDNLRDLALFNMAVDSKLRGCDLVALLVRDVYAAGRVKERASMIQSKTGKPVRFEIPETTRQSLECWIRDPEMIGLEFL